MIKTQKTDFLNGVQFMDLEMNNKITKGAKMTNKLARVAIDLSVADHKRLKTVASLMGMTMKDLVVVSVGDYVCRKLSKVSKTTLTTPEKNKKKPVKKSGSQKIERLI